MTHIEKEQAPKPASLYSKEPSSSVSRRYFLGMGIGALFAVTACDSAEPSPGTPDTTPAATSVTPKTEAPQLRVTVDALFKNDPFYIAHRGSGDNWVEHTMEAYTRSVDAGALAIEVSVRSTSDGVLVCHHDANTMRTTGIDKPIAQTTWAELSKVRNDAREWLGPAAAIQPVPLLKDVLDKFSATMVLFIEDKADTNTHQLLDLMDTYPESKSHFVWKQWAGSKPGRVAAKRGYLRWGYITEDLIPRVAELAPEFDYLGVNAGFTDQQMKQVVALGKPVICWEVHRRSQRDHLVKLGVQGMMCSNIPHVTSSTALATRDSFGTGMRAAGDLPSIADRGWGYQPVIDQQQASLLMNGLSDSYLMGSLGPLAHPEFDLSFDMRWPLELPTGQHGGGIAFGVADDAPYLSTRPGTSAGHHLLLRRNGLLELYGRKGEPDADKLLASVQTSPIRPGQWVAIDVKVRDGMVSVMRDGDPQWAVSVPGTVAGDGYISLVKDYSNGASLEYRRIELGHRAGN